MVVVAKAECGRADPYLKTKITEHKQVGWVFFFFCFILELLINIFLTMYSTDSM